MRLHPPPHAAFSVSKADDWTLDMDELEKVFTTKTRILASLPLNQKLDLRFANAFLVLGSEYSVSIAWARRASLAKLFRLQT